MQERIYTILQQEFQPTELEVINESYKHQGHAGYSENGDSHFRVVISSSSLSGLTKLQAHRAIYKALGGVMERIHALSIDTPLT